MKKEPYVKICPQCGGEEVKSIVTAWMQQEDKCQKCGFTGMFPEIAPDKVKDYKEKIKK